MKQSIRTMIWGALVLVSSVCTAWAEYKPMDVSDIKGKQRKDLMELVTKIKQLPSQAVDCYICEQLGLFFKADGSAAMKQNNNRPATYGDALFIGRTKQIMTLGDAIGNLKEGRWGEIYDKTLQFKLGVPLYCFAKNVTRVVKNTARHLLKEMPDDARWALLATLDKKLYYPDVKGASRKQSRTIILDSGHKYSAPGDWEGYFVGADGKEEKAWDAIRKKGGIDYTRWGNVVLACGDLIGARDILTLFPDEVKAMHQFHKQKIAEIKKREEEAIASMFELVEEQFKSGKDDHFGPSTFLEKKYGQIAISVGLYYGGGNDDGFNYICSWLNPHVVIYMPDGHSVSLRTWHLLNELQQIPQEIILEHYKEPIRQMARHFGKAFFKKMPPLLRDLERAYVARKFVKKDGSPATDVKDDNVFTLRTFTRNWTFNGPNVKNLYFVDSFGEIKPFSLQNQFVSNYGRTMAQVALCMRILGTEELLELIPPAHENEKPDTASEEPQKTAMGGTTAASPKDTQYEEGIAALRRMPAALRRAWLAENMGLCYAQSNAPAYTAPHIANDDALFVDEQGKERKLSEVATDKMTPDWVAATKAALAVGHEQVAAPFTEELKKLAVQTATHILNAIDETPRYSWLAEMNHLIFNPNGQSAYPPEGKIDFVDGFKIHSPNVNYGGKLYYNPQGKISQPASSNVGWRHWFVLFRCADVAGIEAINAEFKADVEAMRAFYEKSPFYKK